MINEEELKNHPRYLHSVGVMEMALKLNEYYNLKVDNNKIREASLLHDITKNLSNEENLEILEKYLPKMITRELLNVPLIWHSFTGAVVAKIKYHINDEEVLKAIFYHTTGHKNMTNLEKLIFLSDYIELGRIGDYFEKVRKIAFESLDRAIVVMLEEQFKYLNAKKSDIYSLSIETYNYYKEVIKNGWRIIENTR